MEIQPRILEKLKCSDCQHYLSCAPVFLKKNGENICGRCPPKSEEMYRNTAYEEVISMLAFPCRFSKEGCKKNLTIIEVKNHEKNCEYQKISCPAPCKWKGFSSDLQQHFRDKHSELIVNQPYFFQHDVIKNNEKSLLTTMFGFLFLIQIKFNQASSKIFHSVQLVGCSKIANQFKYHLNIIKHEMKLTTNQLVEEFSKESKNTITFDTNALSAIVNGFQDLWFTLSIIRHEFKCIACLETITETTTKPTVDCATFCDNCTKTTDDLLQCVSHMDGCTYRGNNINMPKHLQWFCQYGINKCQFCNNMFKTETRIHHLLFNCNTHTDIMDSTNATNELNVNEKCVVMRVSTFEKVFFCIFFNKRKNLFVYILTEQSKEEMSKFSIEITVGSDTFYTKNHRLVMSDESNSDWKGIFNVGNTTTNVKFLIKKCK